MNETGQDKYKSNPFRCGEEIRNPIEAEGAPRRLYCDGTNDHRGNHYVLIDAAYDDGSHTTMRLQWVSQFQS